MNICFCSYMKLFSVFYTHLAQWKFYITIWYSVTTIWVLDYYLEISNGPNTDSSIRSQLFELFLASLFEKMETEKINVSIIAREENDVFLFFSIYQGLWIWIIEKAGYLQPWQLDPNSNFDKVSKTLELLNQYYEWFRLTN